MKPFNEQFRYIFYASLLAPVFVLFSFTTAPSVLETILKKLQQYHAKQPQEKLYLHTDKPFYAAGESIWFKAYLMEASFHSLDSQSRVVYVELMDADKRIFKRQMLYAAGGITFGDFQLPDTLREGKYAIRAYTNFMKNAGEDFFFKREFPILNSLRRHSSPVHDTSKFNSLELAFFPEGGNLVACGFNRIAFKAHGPDGKGIHVEGAIVDDNSTVITSFKSQHNGMGLVRINPVPGKKYFARITKPYGVNRSYPLPDVQEKGYVMQVDRIKKNIKLIIFTNTGNSGSGGDTVNIVVQSRGKAYHAQQGVITNNTFFTLIPTSTFPDGISQITVFDAAGRPVAERLVHQNHNETLNLIAETDTTIYQKRKMVTVLMDAAYNNGSPAWGNFSISVYNESLIQNPEKYPISIINYLSLTSDLPGYIEDPGYYFKDSLPETKKNLDLLMMVNGWRRFTWSDILGYNPGESAFRHEMGIPISGKVLKVGGKRPPAGSILKILAMDGTFVVLTPDSLGRFYTDSFLYYDSMKLVFQTENLKGKKQPHQVMLDPVSLPAPTSYTPTAFEPFDASAFLQQQAYQNSISKFPDGVVLTEVKVTAKKERDPRLVGFSGEDRLLDIAKTGINYAGPVDLISTRVPLTSVQGNPPRLLILVRGKEVAPVFIVNGMEVDQDFVSSLPLSQIDYIEVLGTTSSMRYDALRVVNVVLKKDFKEETLGINQVTYAGFYHAREFYSPTYDIKDPRHDMDDKRTTLFWEPVLETNREGRAAVAFYTGDVASRYRVVIEGITSDGYPGMATTVFEVK